MKSYDQMSEKDGEELVKAARDAVACYLEDHSKLKLDDAFKSKFSSQGGIFVTLSNRFGLRGCIGYPLPDKKLHVALVDAAIAAATEDPRFTPVALNELDQITFEVTVLTPPEVIHVSSPHEYPTKIKVGRHGLIIKKGFHSGLLLPQVPVEYGWKEEEFLAHTCEKAGLPRDCWMDSDTIVYKFEGIVFKEKTPHGQVVKEELAA
jgi:uncharacterized protein (TIGR00296 family)